MLRPFSDKLSNSKLKYCFIEILRRLVQLIKLYIVQFVCLVFFRSVRDNPSADKPSFQAKAHCQHTDIIWSRHVTMIATDRLQITRL